MPKIKSCIRGSKRRFEFEFEFGFHKQKQKLTQRRLKHFKEPCLCKSYSDKDTSGGNLLKKPNPMIKYSNCISSFKPKNHLPLENSKPDTENPLGWNILKYFD